MVIWRGAGILVVVYWIFASLLDYGLGAYFGQQRFADSHPWLYGVRGLIAGAMIYRTAVYFDRKPGRTLVDKTTGEEVTITAKHDFFFIPFKYWSFIVAIIGFLLALQHRT